MKKSKILGMLFLFCFFLSFISSVSKFTNPEIKGLNISSEPNVEIISNSEYITTWDFIDVDNDIPEVLFNETITNSSYPWSLTTSDNDYELTTGWKEVSYDTYIQENYPNNNHGNKEYIYLNDYYSGSGDSVGYTAGYFGMLTDYYLDNSTDDSTLKFFVYNVNEGRTYTIHIYRCEEFNETSITWNTQVDIIDHANDDSITTIPYEIKYINLSKPSYFYFLNHSGSTYPMFTQIRTREYPYPSYRPMISHYLSKIGHNFDGNGYVYMQTDENEFLKLSSTIYNDLSVQKGDKIEVKFNTTSQNSIRLGIIDNGFELNSYEINPQGNRYTTTKTVYINVDANYTFNQFEITSSFGSEDVFVLDRIRILRYENPETYYLNPNGLKTFYLPNVTHYLVNVYEKNILAEYFDFTTSEELQSLVYTKIVIQEVNLYFYDQSNDFLNFYDYIVYVNYSYYEEDVVNERLTSNIFYVDEDTLIQVKIYDSFDILIKTYETYEKTFIDISFNVYSLKIKNEATEIVEYSLENNETEISKSGVIFSDEIVVYSVATGNYSFNYTNHEDMYPREYNFELTNHKTLSINSTYHTVYFSLFTYDGLGINRDLVRFYINSERKDFGFNVIDSETANLLVLDFFNNTLANQTIDASAYSEYNIFIEIYSLIILNQFTYEDIVVNITQIGSDIWMTQIIPKQFGFTYRFIPNVNYNITVYFTNMTFYNSRIVNLTDNSHIESFGIPTQPSEYPKNVYFGIYTTTGLGINYDLVKFYIDDNRTDFGFNRIENMIIHLEVMDYFDSILFDQYINTSGIYEYNILITLYSLKVKNEAREIIDYTLKIGVSETEGNIFPGEIIEYQLATNNYFFEYTNNEDGSFHTININLNQNRIYILNTTFYDIYFSLYDTNLHPIILNQYEFRLNNSIYDFGLILDLQTDDYNITIKDRFGTYLFNDIINLRNLNEYRIEISLYELQIRHLAKGNSNLTLIETLSGNSYSFIMAPDSIKSIIIGSSNYTLNWTNGENNQLTTFHLNLIEDIVIKLNSTYFDVYFSLYNYNGLGLDANLFKFYINNERKPLGFNILNQSVNNLRVLDYFDEILYNFNVNLTEYKEFNIQITVYTVFLINNFNRIIEIEILRGGKSAMVTLGSRSGTEVQLLPNSLYKFSAFETNGTKIETKTEEIDEDYKVVDFGFFEENVPVIPRPVQINTIAIIITILGVAIFFAVIFIIYIKIRFGRYY